MEYESFHEEELPMSRHPFSRRAHRRKRTGGLRGSRFSADPFAGFGDGWIAIKPRFQKIIGKRVLRVSSGRRIGGRFLPLDPEGRHTVRFHEEKPDPRAPWEEELAQRMRTHNEGASVDNPAEHGA